VLYFANLTALASHGSLSPLVSAVCLTRVMHAGPGGKNMRSRGLQRAGLVWHARPPSTSLQSTCAGGHGE